jgi:hypothetical protein
MNGRLRVHCFALSVDGCGAGPAQSLEHPLGVGGTELHQWSFATRAFRGLATLRAYLRAGLVGGLHLAVAPMLLGRGEALFAGLDLHALGYRCAQSVAGEMASHMLLTRAAT